ncbi:myosin-binding protein C, fast-type isoform X3 [Prionailurus viverrinus]|uniref:myosin-binding protein C, fast-type isoform X3 n=1 Tax=Prionailurus viverrinus TaxID=61388 RepID=UPI001FF6F23C|nr:myosin-binding protein C, fast-type isoform X3 [Prionailurus viverrinus]
MSPSSAGQDSLWGWDLSPAVPAASYEAFNPAVANFGHPQGVQLCYGPSTYSPMGSLDPAPSLEAPGPSFPAYPTEEFTSQTVGPPAYAPYPSPVLSEEEDLLLDSPTLEVSDSESDEALMAGPEGRGSEAGLLTFRAAVAARWKMRRDGKGSESRTRLSFEGRDKGLETQALVGPEGQSCGQRSEKRSADMPEAKPAAKKAPKGKDEAKPAPKEAAPKEAPAQPPKEAPPEDQSPTAEEPTGLFLKKPDSVSVENGKDAVIVAKVNGKELPGKPAIKWFKGKWLELGSKSGARFSFKESHDSASNVYTVELHIGKVVLGDRGNYRLEVKAKDVCDSCAFNIDVEVPRQDTFGQGLESFKRSGEGKSDDGGELDFSGLLKKREVVEEEKKKKKDDDDLGIPPEIWELLKGAKKSEYEKIAFQYGITDLRGMLKRLKKAKVEVKKSAAFTKKLDPAYQVDKGNKIKLVVEISDPDLPLKWFKNGQEIKPSSKYVFENVGKKRILTINKCTLADDAAYEVAVKDEKCFTELFVKEPPVLIVTPLEDQQVFVGDRVEMSVEVSEDGAQVMWMKDGVELTREDSFKARYRFKKDGKRHILIYSEVALEDGGRYQVMTNGGQCEAELIVEEKQLEVLQDIADLTVKASEQAVFKCEVSDEKVTGKWYKNGIEVRPSKRITISHVGRVHKLVIDDVRPEDEGDYTFVPDGYALSLSAKLNFLEIKVEYVPKQEPPKIHLDCSGKTSENSIVVVAGNKLRLDVSITGEPRPVATWLKEDEVFTAPEGRIHIETQPDSSSFVIESADRADEGRYTIKVTNPVGEDVASIFLRVVDVPDPPEAVRVTSVGEDWAILVWEPPKYDGGQPITGYLLERKKKGSQRWMKLNFEVFTETTYESTKMIEGILYEMRVFAVNAIGVSQPSMNTKPFMPIAPTSEPQHLTVEDVTDTTTTLKWRPPDRIGAGGIDGYLVEYCLEGSEDWVPANTEPVERCGFTVKNLPTGAKILFRVVAVNIAGRSQPATLFQPVTIREIAEPPKIRLPRHLRQTYVRKVGEQLNLVIPFQGKPRPQVVWTKGGAPVDTSRVHVHTSDFDTVFFVRQAARSDSGEYELSVQIENMKDTATIRIRVVEKAGPPENVMVKEVWGTNALVEWQPPRDNGNSEITGYFVQKADKKTMEWFTVYEHNRHTSCTVSDLIVGNEYYFRVYSENICGLSDSPGVSKNTARILKTGLTFRPFEYKEHDFRTPPKFLTPLPDRVVVAGYSAALNCAVRGHPKPKVVWMKNKMEIREDPKFLMTNHQGVLTLNIRRPSPFDAGTYSCRAVNELGEALAECKLEVRVPQ